jgi:hypothetical protein
MSSKRHDIGQADALQVRKSVEYQRMLTRAVSSAKVEGIILTKMEIEALAQKLVAREQLLK